MFKEKDLYSIKKLTYVKDSIEVVNEACVLSRSLPEKRRYQNSLDLEEYFEYTDNLGNIEVVELLDKDCDEDTLRVETIISIEEVSIELDIKTITMLETYIELKRERDVLFLQKLKSEEKRDYPDDVAHKVYEIHNKFKDYYLEPIVKSINKSWNLAVFPLSEETLKNYDVFEDENYTKNRFEDLDYIPETGQYERYNEDEMPDEYFTIHPKDLVLELKTEDFIKIEDDNNKDIYKSLKKHEYYYEANKELHKKEIELINKHIPAIKLNEDIYKVYFSEELRNIEQEFNCDIVFTSSISINSDMFKVEEINGIKYFFKIEIYIKNTCVEKGLEKAVEILKSLKIITRDMKGETFNAE